MSPAVWAGTPCWRIAPRSFLPAGESNPFSTQPRAGVTRVASHEPEQVWRKDCDVLFDEFLRRFLAHEAAEHELMQDAYSHDLGAKD